MRPALDERTPLMAPAPPVPPEPDRPRAFPFAHDKCTSILKRFRTDVIPNATHTRNFAPIPESLRGRPCIVVGIPCFSEDGFTLERTLASLAIQQIQIAEHFKDRMSECPVLQTIVIADGRSHISDSMEATLAKYFGYNSSFLPGEKKHACDMQLILEPAKTTDVSTVKVPIKIDLSWWRQLDCNPFAGEKVGVLYASLLVKGTNRKKHNSHQWIFQGFAEEMNEDLLDEVKKSMLVFATDCGTLYGPGLLLKLYEAMQKNPSVRYVSSESSSRGTPTSIVIHSIAALFFPHFYSACCGHQTVMTARDQRDPVDSRPESFIQRSLRAVQAYDFESGQAIFNGSLALLGFLAVIPGPCGLYRFEAIRGDSLKRYFNIVNSTEGTKSFIVANLKIAEDRVLSNEAVLSAVVSYKRECTTMYVPDAEFFFEAETDLDEFVKQRRRWLNGTFAGYLWLIPRIWESIWFQSSPTTGFPTTTPPTTSEYDDHSLLFLTTALINILSQVTVFFVISLLPGFFFSAFIFSIEGIQSPIPVWRALHSIHSSNASQ